MNKYYTCNDIVDGYSIVKMLGEGRYGIAYLGVNSLGEKVVIKQLKKEMLKRSTKKLIYEEKILQSLDYTKFPKFIGKFKDDYSQGYILEYIEGKTFDELLYQDEYKFSKKEIYEIGSKLLEIVEILYKNDIVHKDIRITNVIEKENKEIVLIDFGLARFVDDKKYTKDMDFWYIADFLIHLYYSSYELETETETEIENPWYEELDLNLKEKRFLKKLMGIEEQYNSLEEIKKDFKEIKS